MADALADFVDSELSGLRRTAFLMTGSWPAADKAVEDALVDLSARGTDFADEPRALAAARQHILSHLDQADTLVDSDRVVTDPSERLLQALGTLDVQQRALVVLGWFARLTDAEIGSALHRTDVASARTEAIAELRAELARTGDQLVVEDEQTDETFARPRPTGAERREVDEL